MKTIHRLKITNFKSIDTLELNGLSPFSVFAGPNGSGKSNFFDVLDFIRVFMRSGIDVALRSQGGFGNIHSEKRKAPYSKRFGFEMDCELPESDQKNRVFKYKLSINHLDTTPKIAECLSIDDKSVLERDEDLSSIQEDTAFSKLREELGLPPVTYPATYSALLIHRTSLAELLRNINLYRIDPMGAKEPSQSDHDPTQLDCKGHNLASVLSRMEKNERVRGAIIERMAMIVPGVEKIWAERQPLDGRTALLFKEQGTRKLFPAHLISDGTIYALCLLVAVLDSTLGRGIRITPYSGITLIEEPERGLHPKAIREIIKLMREKASPGTPIWLTTHNESVVRQLRLEELVLVDKKEGRTCMKGADSGNLTKDNLAPLNLDEAWLSNLLDGGVPW